MHKYLTLLFLSSITTSHINTEAKKLEDLIRDSNNADNADVLNFAKQRIKSECTAYKQLLKEYVIQNAWDTFFIGGSTSFVLEHLLTENKDTTKIEAKIAELTKELKKHPE